MVPVEHAAGPVPSDLHGDSLGHARIDHVPDSSSSEVVADGSWHTGPITSGRPRLPEVLSLCTHGLGRDMCTWPVREQPRNDSSELALQGHHASHLGAKKRLQL